MSPTQDEENASEARVPSPAPPLEESVEAVWALSPTDAETVA